MNDVKQNLVMGFYRLPKMCELLGLSKTTVWELSRHDPDFPKPVKLTSQCTAWSVAEVQRWIESRERVQFKGSADDAC